MLEKLTKLFLLAVAAVLVIAVTAVDPLAEPVRAHHKAGHGGGGDDGGNLSGIARANFEQCLVDCTSSDDTVIQSDLEANMGGQCGVSPTYDYWDPADAGCNPVTVPQIGSSLIGNQGEWHLRIAIGPASEINETVVIDRWTAFDFSDTWISTNSSYQGDVVLDGNDCADLDVLLYNDPKYDDDPGGVEYVEFGGVGQIPCKDNLVIHFRTAPTVSLFDLADGALVDVSLSIRAPTDPPSKKKGERHWEPRFSIDHGQWIKTGAAGAAVAVLTTVATGGQHVADLVETGNGPASRRTLATYDLPARITVTRVAP